VFLPLNLEVNFEVLRFEFVLKCISVILLQYFSACYYTFCCYFTTLMDHRTTSAGWSKPEISYGSLKSFKDVFTEIEKENTTIFEYFYHHHNYSTSIQSDACNWTRIYKLSPLAFWLWRQWWWRHFNSTTFYSTLATTTAATTRTTTTTIDFLLMYLKICLVLLKNILKFCV